MFSDFFNVFSTNNLNYYSIKDKIICLFKSYILIFLFVFLSYLLIKIVDYLTVEFTSFSSISDQVSKHNVIKKYSFFQVVLFAPLIEETLFRLVLVINRKNITIGTFFIIFYLLGGNVFKLNEQSIFSVSISLIVALITFLYYKNLFLEISKLKLKLLIFSCIVFALVHIFNLPELYWQLILIYPFYVLPQFFIGYFIANLRIKVGFIWGIYLHCLINLVAFSLR